MELLTTGVSTVLSLIGSLGLGQLIHLRFSRKQTPQENYNAAVQLNSVKDTDNPFLLRNAFVLYSGVKNVPSTNIIKHLLADADKAYDRIKDFNASIELCAWDGRRFYIKHPKWLPYKSIVCNISIAFILILVFLLTLLVIIHQSDLKTQLVFTGLFFIVCPLVVIALHFLDGELKKIYAAKRLAQDVPTTPVVITKTTRLDKPVDLETE